MATRDAAPASPYRRESGLGCELRRSELRCGAADASFVSCKSHRVAEGFGVSIDAELLYARRREDAQRPVRDAGEHAGLGARGSEAAASGNGCHGRVDGGCGRKEAGAPASAGCGGYESEHV